MDVTPHRRTWSLRTGLFGRTPAGQPLVDLGLAGRSLVAVSDEEEEQRPHPVD